jgi:hypothetical protein
MFYLLHTHIYIYICLLHTHSLKFGAPKLAPEEKLWDLLFPRNGALLSQLHLCRPLGITCKCKCKYSSANAKMQMQKCKCKISNCQIKPLQSIGLSTLTYANAQPSKATQLNKQVGFQDFRT